MRELLVLEFGLEIDEALDCVQARGVGGDGGVEGERVVLADVVVGEVGLVGVVEPQEAGVGEVLLVGAKGDALGIEEVDDR